MNIDKLVCAIGHTNPKMTKDKLMEELRKSNYATVAILMTMENVKRVAD
jgi:hypothetical protein